MKTLRHILPLLATLAMATVMHAATAPTTPVSIDSALRDAAKLTARNPDLQAMRVAGASMLPYFGEGSVLVVKAARAESLKPGMVVVYTSRFGETVAHRVIGGDAVNGWEVKGYNNATADTTRVTDANLIGTVYATLHASAANPADAIGLGGVPVAMAAPAR
ncbi:MAG: signal peptidase I [Verrucomicrobiota bacterium]